ncbi:hypothetical protein [Clostridium ihumii]|uniref:hypothetical protein n=1 Tax=Clostridium ihumii TaxID=1470356 RepID=UPI00058CE638|nr:hypothetical protein [Clostridium ihumii]
MTIEEIRKKYYTQKGREEGIEKGRKEEKLELAIKLLDILDDETISLKVGLDINEVKKIREEMEAGN